MSISAAGLEQINVSALNQYAYCPRRFALIYLEGQFEQNIHTQRGNAEHERVDRISHSTTRGGARVEYALPIWSDTLGLIGKCDVVEFAPDGTVYPVEYKHGPRRAWINDDVQLAAQAMCLEEMLGVAIPVAAIFHAGSKRRREVDIDASLRAAVVDTLTAMRLVLAREKLPPPIEERQRCKQCSLNERCQPDAARADMQAARVALFNPDA